METFELWKDFFFHSLYIKIMFGGPILNYDHNTKINKIIASMSC